MNSTCIDIFIKLHEKTRRVLILQTSTLRQSIVTITRQMLLNLARCCVMTPCDVCVMTHRLYLHVMYCPLIIVQ